MFTSSHRGICFKRCDKRWSLVAFALASPWAVSASCRVLCVASNLRLHHQGEREQSVARAAPCSLPPLLPGLPRQPLALWPDPCDQRRMLAQKTELSRSEALRVLLKLLSVSADWNSWRRLLSLFLRSLDRHLFYILLCLCGDELWHKLRKPMKHVKKNEWTQQQQVRVGQERLTQK